MTSVPVGEFKDNASAFIAAAEAGEDIVITRHGKPAVRLVPIHEDRRQRRGEIIDQMIAMGKAHYAKYGPTTAEEIIEWKNEGRR